MGGIISIEDDAVLSAEQVKELVGEGNVSQFEALSTEGGTITGAQLKEKYAAHQSTTVVSVHPYFEIPEGKRADFDEAWSAVIPVVQEEPGCLHYEFAFNGNVCSVRESYANAEAVLVHNGNVGATIGKVLEYCKLLHLDVVGSEAELAKLREPMAALGATFFTVEAGFRKPTLSGDPSVTSIVPYFNIPVEKIEEFKTIWAPVIPVVLTEEANQYYEFSYFENQAFVREAYLGAEGVLAHLGNAGAALTQSLEFSTLSRPLQIFGSAEELDKLREPLAAFSPDYFVITRGFRK